MISAAQSAKIKNIAYKCAIYTIALFFVGIAQVTFFSRINIFSATPDLLLAAIALLCMKEDHKVTAICAIISGVFYCAFGGSEYPIYILFSFVCGYVMWIFAGRAFGKSYASFLAVCATLFAAKALFNMFYSTLFSSTFSFIRTLSSIVLPEFVSSMIFCSVSYIIFNTLNKIMNRKSRRRKELTKNEF
jgi:rod shape-determining protein MreD